MTRALIGIPTKEGIACYMASADGQYFGLGEALLHRFNNEKTFSKLVKGFYKYTGLDYTSEKQLICKTDKEFKEAATADVFVDYAYLFRNNKWYGGVPNRHGKRWLLNELTESKVAYPDDDEW